ncbi:MAG: nucleotidyltransferase domain-containing protein [Ruminococcus sp.]|nr:nucleotidyltransferase domain-containing protein [Ruminococcus sp.]
MSVYSIREIQEKVRPIAQSYGTGNIYLFGSYARGEATEKSDLDFIVEAGNARGIKFFVLFDEFKEAFGKEVDILSAGQLERNKNDPFYREFIGEIEKDRVEIYKCQ